MNNKMSNEYRVLTLTSPDVENGKGCRVTIWCAGCSHHCPGCHNQHTWDYNQGKPIMELDVITKIFDTVNKPYIKGITLSGGDPLSQSYESLSMLHLFLRVFKEEFPEKDVWIFAGEKIEEAYLVPIKRKILKMCDVMVDGPFIKSLYDSDLAFRGSSNQRIIDLHTMTDEKGNKIEVSY